MPPTQDQIDKAVETLGAIELKSFTAEPSTVLPLNDVTLRWEATKPSGPAATHVVFTLQGLKVANSGTRTVRPVRPAIFTLSAEAFTVKKTLGTVLANVDLSHCSVNSIDEVALSTRLRFNLNEEFPEDRGKKVELEHLPDLTVRVKNDRTRLTVDLGGMKIAAEFDVEINNAPDGTLKVDALIGLGAEGGQPVHKILKFNPDFDFSGVIDILTPGLAQLAEKIIEILADDKVRNAVDKSVKDMLSELRSLLPRTCTVLSVSPVPKRVDFTLCPTQAGVVCRPPLLRLV
jgi:hypothetical protein